MNRRHLRSATIAGALLLMSACSAAPDVSTQADAPVATSPATAQPTETHEPAESPTVTTEPDDTEVQGENGGAASGPDASSGPQTVSTDLADTPLGLSEVFAVVGEWEENRYEVADRSDVAGMGVSVATCYDDDRTPQLEYRLANRFSTLRFDVAQSNASRSSDQLLAVVVLGNEEQLDIQKVPFNQVKPIEVDITGVNALKLRFYLESDDGCRYDTEVTTVIEDLTVR